MSDKTKLGRGVQTVVRPEPFEKEGTTIFACATYIKDACVIDEAGKITPLDFVVVDGIPILRAEFPTSLFQPGQQVKLVPRSILTLEAPIETKPGWIDPAATESALSTFDLIMLQHTDDVMSVVLKMLEKAYRSAADGVAINQMKVRAEKAEARIKVLEDIARKAFLMLQDCPADNDATKKYEARVLAFLQAYDLPPLPPEESSP